MKAALITIGSELLRGFTLNTNAQFIGKKFAENGVEIGIHLCVPDRKEAIFSALSYAAENAELVITTGGIGPTLDDLTIEFVREWVEINAETKIALASLRDKVSSLKESALQEEFKEQGISFTLLPNTIGVCRGVHFCLPGCEVATFPGVPYEMEPMIERFLLSRFGEKKQGASEMVYLLGLKEREVDPTLRKLQDLYPDVEIGIYPHFILQSIRLQVDEEKLCGQLTACKESLRKIFAAHLLPDCEGKIERALYLTLASIGKTIAVAESCTGGRIASMLTTQPGVSSVFKGAVIAYNNDVKKDLLFVSDNILNTYGAVSQEVAVEMAVGVKEALKTDFALSTTGIAGPSGGGETKPVGTVWIGYALANGKTGAVCLHTKGGRQVVIERSCVMAIGVLLREIMGR